MEVRIEGGGKTIRLDDEQLWVFAGELAKTRATHASKGVAPRVAPDCKITITGSGWEEQFEIYARAVLRNVATDESWQFYFGLIVMEWLGF